MTECNSILVIYKLLTDFKFIDIAEPDKLINREKVRTVIV